MKTLKWGGPVEIGDPVLIVHDKYIILGICAGWGKNTVQYFNPPYVVRRDQYFKDQGKIGKIEKAYVIMSNPGRAIKINVDMIPLDEKADFDKALDILKLRK